VRRAPTSPGSPIEARSDSQEGSVRLLARRRLADVARTCRHAVQRLGVWSCRQRGTGASVTQYEPGEDERRGLERMRDHQFTQNVKLVVIVVMTVFGSVVWGARALF
jgi:hypothetical protein